MPKDSQGAERPVRVVIVDDTRSIRAVLRALLSESPQIEVVGEAADPYEARELIRELQPDVITLDVEMPRMSGLSFLERIMRLRPMPVVMVSARTTENSREAIKALALGAVDCIDRAMLLAKDDPVDLVETILMAAESNVGGFANATRSRQSVVEPEAPFTWNERIVVMGSSTGGVDALLTVLSNFPRACAPTVIAQHMPADFLESFTKRLNKSSAPKVELARDGIVMEPGHVYVAPGGNAHVALASNNPLRLQLVPHDGTETFVPSVNVLFSSAVAHGDRIVGVMLTGMGHDGADAMLAMREAGAHTIVQDAASSVVDGMPKSAREIGAAIEVAPLSDIGRRIYASVSRDTKGGKA